MSENQKPKIEIDRGEERLWNTLCHLSALAGSIVPPFGLIIGPLVVWLLKRHDIPSVDEHGKEALNFQISMMIYGFISLIFSIILIGIPVLIAIIVADFIFIIVASIKANNGESFHYPASIRLIR